MLLTRRRALGALVGATAAVSCSPDRAQWVAPDRPCPGALRPVWMADPHYTMCVVTSYRTQDLRTWRRERPGSAGDVLSVQVGASRAQLDLTGGWPPRLGAPEARGAHASGAGDSVTTRTDTSAGVVFHTELGLRPGPESGGAPVPSFVSGFRSPDGQYVIGSGQSASSVALDTVLLMFRTVTRSSIPDPNPRK